MLRRLIISLILVSSSAQAAPVCQDVFRGYQQVQAKEIYFLQNFLGHAWAAFKKAELDFSYEIWNWRTIHRSKENFIIDKTGSKPIDAIRDHKGHIRLVDNHHSFLTIVQFMQGQLNFRVYVRIVKDYSLTNPKTQKQWTGKQMLKDLIKKNWVVFYNKSQPTLKDIEVLPRSILKIPDLPERSVIGFVFRSFEFKLKGSDFRPMIQFRLAQKMREMGIDPVGKNPESQAHIHELRDLILKSPELIEFLIAELAPGKTPERAQQVRSFLEAL